MEKEVCNCEDMDWDLVSIEPRDYKFYKVFRCKNCNKEHFKEHDGI